MNSEAGSHKVFRELGVTTVPIYFICGTYYWRFSNELGIGDKFLKGIFS